MLIVSIGGLVLADWRLRLAFWCDMIASAKTVGFTMLLLLLFDIAGIINNIFTTNQEYVIGLHIVNKNLPVEEILFLFLLCYVTLILFQVFGRLEILKPLDPARGRQVQNDGSERKKKS